MAGRAEKEGTKDLSQVLVKEGLILHGLGEVEKGRALVDEATAEVLKQMALAQEAATPEGGSRGVEPERGGGADCGSAGHDGAGGKGVGVGGEVSGAISAGISARSFGGGFFTICTGKGAMMAGVHGAAA